MYSANKLNQQGDNIQPWRTPFPIWNLPGASMRNSAHGKGHEEGGSAYTKVGSSLRSPPGNFRASTPQNQSLPTLLLCALTYTSDFTGHCPPPPSLSWIGSSNYMWLFRASELWEAWDVLNCLNTDSFEQLKDWLEIVLVKSFSLIGPMFAAKSPYPLPAVSLAVYWLI